MDADYERENNPGGTRQCIFNGRCVVFCYGDEENARIYAVHLTTANQSEIRRTYLVSVMESFNQSVSQLCYDIEYQKSGVYKYAIL